MQIVKGASPDLPGDFAGGIIQINTKGIPDENSISVNLGGQYHSLTTFQSGISGTTSSTDWLGYDGGTRQLPKGLLSTEQSLAAKTTDADFDLKAAQTKSFNNNFKPNNISSYRPNLSFQFSTSRRTKILKNDLGIIFALTYNNSYRYTPFTTNNFQGVTSTSNLNNLDGTSYNYDNYRNNITSGAVLNLTYKVGANNKFSFKNLLTSNAEDQTIHQTGIKYDNQKADQTLYDNYIYYYQSSRLYSSQFTGEHLLSSKSKIKLTYTGSLNDIHREMPDYRRILYQSSKIGGDKTFSPLALSAASDANSYNPQQSGRYFSNLDETMYSIGYDLIVPFKLSFLKKSHLKFGGMNIWRDRSFAARSYMYTTAGNYYNDLLATPISRLDPGQIFANQNISKNTFFLNETTQGTDAYTGSTRLNAAYALFDFKILSRLHFIGGARIEQFNQKLNWVDKGLNKKIDTTYVDILPSVNLIYELTDKVNIRASASKTVSRPEFREYAPMAFYEINYNAIITGEPTLVRTQIYNYDVKFEYYPTAGQLFSVNPFYKNFINPVEASFNGGGTGINSFSYINAPSAKSYGIEFEGRVNLSSVFSKTSNQFLKNLTVFANYSLIFSSVTLNDTAKTSYANSVNNRPLQGQSPYVFNMGVLYSNPKSKLDISLTANQIGRRLAFVNSAQEQLIWENSRFVIDMSISKTFFKKLQTKITVGDLLAQPLVYYQDLNNNGQYDSGTDVTTFIYKYGYTFQFALGYTF
jgi:outer membrane receptor protein involved in Fe transport